MSPPKPRLFIQREGSEAGPYDLAQMAGLLRQHIIDGETPTRLEGDDAWKPFSWQPHFSVAREMSPDATSMRLDELNEEALDRQSPIPLPSRESLLRLCGMLAGCLCLGLGAFCVARLDPTTGLLLLLGGLGAAGVAVCLIYARMLDEDWWTLLRIYFVPFGELFYFVSNFWEYFPLFCLKYGGLSVAAGAACGLGPHLSELWPSL
jgi:hypothetical protein